MNWDLNLRSNFHFEKMLHLLEISKILLYALKNQRIEIFPDRVTIYRSSFGPQIEKIFDLQITQLYADRNIIYRLKNYLHVKELSKYWTAICRSTFCNWNKSLKEITCAGIYVRFNKRVLWHTWLRYTLLLCCFTVNIYTKICSKVSKFTLTTYIFPRFM